MNTENKKKNENPILLKTTLSSTSQRASMRAITKWSRPFVLCSSFSSALEVEGPL